MTKNYTTDNQHNRSFLRGLLPPKGWLVLVLFMMFSVHSVFADGGIGYKGIRINNKGSHTWYKVHSPAWGYNGCTNYEFNGASAFSGQDLGTFSTTDVLQISGYAVVGWTNSGADWVSGRLQYKVWKQGDSEPGAWTTIDVGNYNNDSGATQVVCSSGSDRVVGYNDGTTNINPGAGGTYNIKVQGLGRMKYNGGSFNASDGTEVTATFVVSASAPAVAATTINSNIVGATTASIASNVTADGGASVTERGIVYGTSSNPTTSNTKVTNGTGTGTYNTTMSSLTPGTRYYVRSYAINSVGTSYGTEVSFTTLMPPTAHSVVSASTTSLTVSWTRWTGHRTGSDIPYNVMVVRSTDASFTAPTNGSAYAVSASLGGDTVVYNGAGTSFTDTGLTTGVTYYYALYSEGWSYYSNAASTISAAPAGVVTGAKLGVNFNGAGDVWRYTGAQDACDTGSGVWGSTNLGSMYPSGTLVLSGSNMVATTGATSPTLYYRVYKQGDTPPAFSTYALSTTAACGGGTKYESTNDVTIPAGGYSVAGTYNFEVYHQATNGATINMGTSGTPYTATFVVTAVTAPALAATTINSNHVSATTASIASNVTAENGASVTERGIVYHTSSNPTTSNTKVANGTGTGTYNTSMTGLTPGTRYYVRSYAINSAGTAYGTEVSFTTLMPPTTLTATPVTASTIDLAWTRWSGHRAGSDPTYDVMIVRSSDASFTAPTNGVAYSVSDVLGGDTVIYKGSATTFTDTGLTLSTQYYYAIYSEGWNYYSNSRTANATTPAASAPTLAATTAQTNVTASNADSGGNVTSDGGATVTERGLVFGTSSNPTLSNGTKVTTTGTTGSYTLGLSNLLSPSTTYYVRAYATNAAGTGYGTEITFTTSAASSSTSFYSDRIYFKNGSGADEKYFAAYNVVPNGGCTSNNTETVGTAGWNGRNLGTYTTGTVAKIGGFIVTKGIQNGNTPYMQYRIYETGTTPPSWTSQNMNYVGECNADGVDVNGSSQDKIWRFPLTDFTIPSASGNYTIEVYFSRNGDHMGANGDQFINNGGNNYKAFINVERPTGIFSAKVALKKNSDATAWYNANADTNCDPGSSTNFNDLNNIIVASDGFTLGGNFVSTLAMTNPRLYYTFYAEGSRPASPTFTPINLTNVSAGACTAPAYKYELGATTELFDSGTYTSGTYVLELYFQGTNGGTDYYRKQDTDNNFKCYFNIPEPNDGNLNPTGTNISGIYESYIGQLILGLDDSGNPNTADRKISKVFDLDGSNGSSNNANFDLGSTNPGVSFKIGMEAKVFTKGTHKACGCSSWYYLYKEGTTDPVESDFPLPAAGSTAVLFSQKWGSSVRKFTLMNSSISWQGLNTPFQALTGNVTGYGDNSSGFGSTTPDGTYNGQLGASATVVKFKDYKDRDAFSPASTNMAVDTPVNEVACPTCDGTYRIAVAFLCWVQTDNTKKCPGAEDFSFTTDAPTIIYHRDINQNKIHNGVYLNPRHPNSPYFTSNKNSLPGTSVFYVSKLDVNASGGDTAYTGSWNNGTPNRGKNTTISSNYSTASGSFITNNLTIANGVTLTIRAGEYVEVLNTATTTGTGKVVVEKGGNFVQRCNEKIPANGVPYPNIEHTHQTRTIAPYDYVYWSSPIRENLGPTLVAAGMGRMFHWEGGAGGGWRGMSNTSADVLGAGKGFIAWNAGSAPAAFAPKFVGTATNGEVEVAVTKEDVYPDESDEAALLTYASNFNNYALLGNPYPCALDAREFLVHANNQHIGGTVYIWTSNSRISLGNKGIYDSGDYATYTLAGGTAASNAPEYAYDDEDEEGPTYGNNSNYAAGSNRMIYSGSGFFVLVKENGDAFFNNEMRSITGNSNSGNNWALFKQKSDSDDVVIAENEENRLWLSVRNEKGAYRQTLLSYKIGATEGYDGYLDALVNSSNAVNIYTKSKQGHKLVIQARPESLLDANETVPLILSSKEADDFYITVDMFEGKFKNKDIYLRDKKLGVDHDFSTGKYHFSTESGTYEDRFEIVYKDKPKASIEEPADVNAPLKVAVSDHLISISKAGQKIAKVELVNILGKQIAEKLYKESSEKVEIHDIIKANQVLIVKVTYADGSKETKKIIF